MKKSILLAAVLAAFSSSSVFAGGGSLFGGGDSDSSDSALIDDSGSSDGGGSGAGTIYGGASIGKSSNSTCESIVDQAGVLVGDFKCPTPTGWKVFGGYKFTPGLAIEGSYVDFGSATSNGTIPVVPGVNNVPNAASLKSKASGFGVSGVASTDVSNEVSLFGKMGLMAWKNENTATIQDVGGMDVSKTIKTDGVDLSLGAGAEYKIDDNWGIRGEVEHFNGVNANLYSVGATFSTF